MKIYRKDSIFLDFQTIILEISQRFPKVALMFKTSCQKSLSVLLHCVLNLNNFFQESLKCKKL